MTQKTDVQAPPKTPTGYEACRSWREGGRIQECHLVALDEHGSNGGRPTVCGLSRFDARDANDKVTRRADLPGWGMGEGGVFGPGVVQERCAGCFDVAEPTVAAHA